MTLTFYIFNDDPRRLDKSGHLQKLGEVSGVLLKEDTALFEPTFILKKSQVPYDANYCYCPNTNRYYFINNMRSLIGRRLEISARVDVLYSFCDDIKASPAWLERTSDLMVNDEWLEQDYPFQNNAVTESIDFPNVCFDDGADLNTLLIMSP